MIQEEKTNLEVIENQQENNNNKDTQEESLNVKYADVLSKFTKNTKESEEKLEKKSEEELENKSKEETKEDTKEDTKEEAENETKENSEEETKEKETVLVVDGEEVSAKDVKRLLAQKTDSSDIDLAVNQWGLDFEDLALMRDIKNGDKEALKHFVLKNEKEIEGLDFEKEEKYSPETKIEKPTAVSKKMDEIAEDEEWQNNFNRMFKIAPQETWETLAADENFFLSILEVGKTNLGVEIFTKADNRAKIRGIDFNEALISTINEFGKEQKKKNESKDNKKTEKSERKKNAENIRQQMALGTQEEESEGAERRDYSNMSPEEFFKNARQTMSKYKE